MQQETAQVHFAYLQLEQYPGFAVPAVQPVEQAHVPPAPAAVKICEIKGDCRFPQADAPAAPPITHVPPGVGLQIVKAAVAVVAETKSNWTMLQELEAHASTLISIHF